MVKGISKQVIVVHSPDPKLFEQAIFILREDAVKEGISQEALLKEAQKATLSPPQKRLQKVSAYIVSAMGGAMVTAIVWLVSIL